MIGVRIALHVGAIGRRGVLEALLVDIQIAQARIQQVRIRPIAVLGHVLVECLRAFRVREGDAHDPQRVFDELAVGALEILDPHRLVARADELGIEHAAERRQALFGQRLFEQRPAVLVEALLVEMRALALLDDDGVGLFGLGIRLRREQQLAAPELHFVHLRAVGILLDDAIQRGERLLGLAGGLVGARELVQHLVVARVVRDRPSAGSSTA